MFPKFSYSNQKLQSFGPPTELLARGLEEKEKKYEYVVDTTEKLKQALSAMPHTSADADKLAGAQNKLESVISGYAEEGDLENKYLDAKRLAGDIDKEFGLSAIQQQHAQQQAYIQEAKDRYAKGDISASDMDRAIAETSYLNRKGVQKGEAGWRSNFTGRKILNKFDAAKEAEDFIKGIKASTIIDPDTGATYEYSNSVQGYINADSGEAVMPERINSAARGYLLQNPDFKDKVLDDVDYELNAMLRDPETGQRRNMTAEDFSKVAGVGVSKSLGEKFNNKSIEELEKEGVNLENLYGQLRAEQEVNRAIAPVVGKNAYADLSREHLTDWGFREGLKTSNQDKTDSVVAYSYLEAFDTEDRYNSQDIKLRTEIRAQAIDEKAQLEKDLQRVDANDPGSSPRIKKRIEELENTIEKTNQFVDEVLELSPSAKKRIKEIAANEGEAYDITSGFNEGSIEGLNINEGQVMELVNTAMSRQLSLEELAPYVGGMPQPNEYGEEIDTNPAVALRHKINAIATNVKDKIEDEDLVYNRTYNYLNLGDLSAAEKRASSYHQLDKQIGEIPSDNPNFHTQFNPVNSDMSLVDMITEEYDLSDDDEIQWEKAKIKPLLNNRKDKNGEYRPVYGISVPVNRKDNDAKDETVTITAYGNDKNRDARYVDAMKDMYRKYSSINNPSSSQRNVKEALATNLFNLTKQGKEFDLYDLRGAKNRQVFDIQLDDEGTTADIMAFTKGSPDNKKYYLIEPSKKDRMGNPLFYASNSSGELFTYTADQIKSSSDLTAVGANTPTGLKQQLASMWAQIKPEYKVNTDNLIDARSVFGNDVKENVDARVTPQALDSLKILKSEFPDLYLTDGLRKKNSTIGAKDSYHKVGNAVDLKNNTESRKLAEKSPQYLNRMGVRKIEFHEDHFHVVFL